jgi:hypothetical protein
MDAGRDFETKIVVKVNAPDVLRRELAAPRWNGEHIAMAPRWIPAIDTGATQVSPILLHLRLGIREQYLPCLEEHYPELLPRYLELYRRPYAPAPARKDLEARVASIVRSVGGLRPRGPSPTSSRFGRGQVPRKASPAEGPTQLRLL